MSYTTIIAVYPGEKTEDYQELRNSWGSAPVVWQSLVDCYIDPEKKSYLFSDGTMDKLWPLWKRDDIPLHQRAVLLMTFDRAYVAKKDYERAASDIDKFFQDFPPTVGNINHWPEIARLFRGNPEIPGIGLYATSVSDNPFNGAWNEEAEDYDPPDWSEIYDVYQSLDALSDPAPEQPCPPPR